MEYADFISNCHSEDVVLPRTLADCDWLSGSICFQPNDWYAATAAAGDLLRRNPARKLSNKLLSEELFGDKLDTLQTAFRSIINASIDRLPALNVGTDFPKTSNRQIDACAGADDYFAVTFNAMRRPAVDHKIRSYAPIAWTILHDECQPVGITKTYGEPSTLSLVPLTVSGIPFPAGSIFNAYMPSRILKRRNDKEKLAFASKEISTIAFMRLSAFAVKPEVRIDDFADMIAYSKLAPAAIETITMDEIRKLAANALDAIPSTHYRTNRNQRRTP